MHTLRLVSIVPLLVATVAFLIPRTAQAQPAAGPIVTGSVAAAIGNDSTNVSFAGSAGYRFNRAFGLGAELTWIPGIEDRDDYGGILPAIYPIPRFETETDLLMFTTNIRIEVPTTSSRILPFVIAGGGLASTTTKTEYGPIIYALAGPGFDYGQDAISLPASFPVRDSGFTQTHLALTIGGGVSIAAGKHLSIDVDLREIHLSGSRSGGDIARFGGGVSYRF